MKLFIRFFMIIVAIVALCLIIAPPALAQGPEPPLPTDLGSLLNWLTSSGGAAILLGWAAAWYLEPLAWWQKLKSQNRQLIILGGSLILGLFSIWVQTQPGLIAALNPYFTAAIAIITVWIATQIAHKTDPAAR